MRDCPPVGRAADARRAPGAGRRNAGAPGPREPGAQAHAELDREGRRRRPPPPRPAAPARVRVYVVMSTDRGMLEATSSERPPLPLASPTVRVLDDPPIAFRFQ